MDIASINLGNYDLTVLAYSEFNDPSIIPARQFKVKFGAISNPDMEKLIQDMVIMNEVRGNNTPAVREAFEQLLTVLALTNTGIKK